MIITVIKHMGTDYKPSVQEVEMTNGLSVNRPRVLILHNSISQISPCTQTFKIFLQPCCLLPTETGALQDILSN